MAGDAKFCDICGEPAVGGREFYLVKAGITVAACDECIAEGFVVESGSVVSVVGNNLMAAAVGALFERLEQEGGGVQ